MSMPDAFKNIIGQAFTTNVNKMSLHTADPGTSGANDSGIGHATVTWSGPTAGVATASVAFNNLSGNYTHVGLWEDSTFRQGIECAIHYTTQVNITVLLSHTVGEDT